MTGDHETAASAAERANGLFELTLVGNGVDLRRSITEDIAAAVIAMVISGKPLAEEMRIQAGSRVSPTAPPSIGEHLEQVNATSNPEKIAAIASFLADVRGMETFTRNDVRAQFRAAGESLPRNLPRDWAIATARRWIAEAEAGGHYFITRSGRRAVESAFRDSSRTGIGS